MRQRTLAVLVSSILFTLSILVDYSYRFPDALDEAQIARSCLRRL